MRVVDVIAKKRDGNTLSREEIELFVNGVTCGTLPDYQVSALLMAIVLRGMTIEETSWLTDSIVNSGTRVDLSDIPGVKVGKHSTGGVGDKVSIALAPLTAACGVVMPKMSGRGLGHTGGTLDKLESIPGYRVDLDVDEFKAVLKEVGTSIIGQTASLVPADKKLYALRDVTATIGSIPLISASVMSKKLAEGSDVVMLDVKCGDGAFMKDEGTARALASTMVAIGTRAGVRTEAFITDMDTPLGRAVGNSLEIVECLDTLQGRGPEDLSEVVKRFATRALVLAGRDSDDGSALHRIEQALSSGKAIETLGRMIERQGGDRRVIDDYSLLPSVAEREQYLAPRDGFVSAVKAGAIGVATNLLGAGRSSVDDRVDPAVGVVLHAKPGARVTRGQPLLEIHHRDGRAVSEALSICSTAFIITDEPPMVRPVILGDVR
jgi:pyrimidine-nucleoside phosphorylase